MLSPYTRAKFRVKIKSLAEESRIIRAEEARALQPFRVRHKTARATRRAAISEQTLDVVYVHQIAKSAAVIAKSGDSRRLAATGLHLHRSGILRAESRATLLAYAYARGLPYTKCERTDKAVDVKRVFEILRSLIGFGDHFDVTPATIIKWTEEAKVTA